MNTNNLKIAWRAAWKSKLFTALNVFGLAIGFAGFILAYAYINREGSYDRWNPNYENIYLIGLIDKENASDYTPAALAPALKAAIPEIETIGRVARAPFETPFISENDMFFVKNWLGADRTIADIFAINIDDLSIARSPEKSIGLLSAEVGQTLFPDEDQAGFNVPKRVSLVNEQSGVFENIHGISKPRLLSNFEYDYIGFREDIAEGKGDGDNNVYQTYMLVKPETKIKALTHKINTIYQNNIAKQRETKSSTRSEASIYLDPLKNLHLRPKNGSDTGYKIVWTLGVLSAVILLLACINFANLMLVQAQKRFKEIGLKKVFGVSRNRLAIQFLIEVFVQCLLAAAIACLLTRTSWDAMSTYFGYDFTSFAFNRSVLFQLGTAVLIATLLSGAYPAYILSGYHPITIIKGQFRNGTRSFTLRSALLAFQFIIAFVFISAMLVINKQMNFMEKSDKGFNVDHIVRVKNLAVFNRPSQFTAVRNRIKAIPGIEGVTVTTNYPGGVAPSNEEFTYMDKKYPMDHIGVDFDYFETLNMDLLMGRTFSASFLSDTTQSIVINESAAQRLGIKQLNKEKISICDQPYTIIGIIKDSKMQGFEQLIKPTAYTLQTKCSYPNHPFKSDILVKVNGNSIHSTLQRLEKQWSSINKLDGKYFIYDFLDQQYAALYAKQEQLGQAFTAFSALVMMVALLGLFSMSAFAINLREKEVSIRKILGANTRQLFLLLNKPFIQLIGLAILVATPVAWWCANKWLEGFAYRIQLSWWIFSVGAALTLLLAIITISYQAIKASIVNPADTLRNE
ncbi:FtsX-like permease family protein [Olivibacter sp. XZL3]|uniref:ABC transporter permease n=1 Tax=Olivibacter sp. XZL3 TaxID=1735116 RepID=UPI001065974B|nr:FtsX-like permease family protein [Olivibacter sp. XZL3]